MTSPWASRLGWAVVLIAGCVMGGWIARSRLSSGASGLLPHDFAELAIQTTPDVAFTTEVRREGTQAVPKLFEGTQSMTLEPGDYFIDVVPVSMTHQRKRLKVHLSGNQKLALPVVLTPSAPSILAVSAPPPEPEAVSEPGLQQPRAAVMDEGIDDLLRSHAGFVPNGQVVIRGRVTEGKPSLDGKAIDGETLSRYVRSRKAAIQGCYEKELRRAPSLKGKIAVRFVITSMGRATSIGIEEDTMGNDAVASCIKSIIRGWVFPFKPDNDVPVVYPFSFTLADDVPARR